MKTLKLIANINDTQQNTVYDMQDYIIKKYM